MSSGELMSKGAHDAMRLLKPRKLDDREREKVEHVNDNFVSFLAFINDSLPQGRYKSMVVTKIEEASMLASKAITHTGE